MDQILGQVLRNAVWERLDMLSELANETDTPALVSMARAELPRLAEGWRVMLKAHEPDERGDCPTCSTRWHRCKAPCSVWQVAHDHLVAGGLAPMTDGRRARRRGTASTTSPEGTRTSSAASPVSPPLPEQPLGRHARTSPFGRHALAGQPWR